MTNNTQLGLKASQVIFSGNAVVGIMLAKIAEQISNINEQSQALDLKKNIKDSYLSVLLANESVKLLEQNLVDLQDVAQKTDAMAKAGAMEQTDADQLLVQVNSLENMLSKAKRNSELSQNILKVQLGLKVDDNLVLLDSIDGVLTSQEDDKILAMPYDMTKDPNYQMVDASVQIAQKQKLNSVMNSMPTLSAYYSMNYNVPKPAFNMTPRNVVGLQLSVPILQVYLGLIPIKTRR